MQMRILLYSDRDTEDNSAEDNLPILSLSLYNSLLQLISFSSLTPFQARQMRNAPAQQVLASLLLPIQLYLLFTLSLFSPHLVGDKIPR